MGRGTVQHSTMRARRVAAKYGGRLRYAVIHSFAVAITFLLKIPDSLVKSWPRAGEQVTLSLAVREGNPKAARMGH